MSMKGVYRIGISSSEVTEESLQKSGLIYHLVNPREQILISAKSVFGIPYKRGASVLRDAPDSFDCSSFTAWLAVEAGLAIPRISIDQYVYSKKIQRNDLKPGDLVFSNTGKIIHTEGLYFSQVLGKEVHEEAIRTETLEFKPGTKVPEGIDHVGIYVGEGSVVHATKSRGVIEEVLDTSSGFQNIIGYGRIIPDSGEKRFVINIPLDRSDLRNKDSLMKEILKYH